MTKLILGYQTSPDDSMLSAFLASVRQAYQKLEEAIMPIDEHIAHLHQGLVAALGILLASST